MAKYTKLNAAITNTALFKSQIQQQGFNDTLSLLQLLSPASSWKFTCDWK